MKRTWQPPQPKSRKEQAVKIRAILTDYLSMDLSEKVCLEVGCADGAISSELYGNFRSISGLEIDQSLLLTQERPASSEVSLVQGDGRLLPFADEHFDVVILAQVYEHMTRQEELASEIYRVLRCGGICFFSGPNRWQVVEPHYFLPFLAWLPHWLANKYLHLSGRDSQFDVYPRGYWGIKRLWRKFEVIDYTWQMLKQPEKFGIVLPAFLARVLKVTPVWLIKLMCPFYRNYNWILVK